jgi:hypothetical protein
MADDVVAGGYGAGMLSMICLVGPDMAGLGSFGAGGNGLLGALPFGGEAA